LTLIEIVVTFTLVVLLVALSLNSLKQGSSKTSTLALAAALTDEFRAARQLAISNGHPVAIGIPRAGSDVANSIYRLEGWNVPRVTWSKGFGGDYPELGFAAAQWSNPGFSTTVVEPPLAKASGFDLDVWAAAHLSDSLICFTPDGGVTTNSLPALDGRYTVVVAQNPQVSGNTITAGSEATAIYISPGGAAEYSKGTPGQTLAAGSGSNPAALKARDNLEGGGTIRISKITIAPASESASADAFCTPGQQVTFELYAYDPEGRELFCQWKQSSSTPRLGTFTVPPSQTGPLRSEVERMEYVPVAPAGVDWSSTTAPVGGCFRARWTWTVPLGSQPGDVYEVEADVQDATGTATIENPPSKFTFPAPPAGRLLVEMFNPFLGRWELVRMNPDGSGRSCLTPPGVEESMPSVDGSGTKLAFLQGPIGNINDRYVKVRSLTGGGEFVIAGPGRYTSVSISPNGRWISYRLDDPDTAGAGTVHFRELGGSTNFSFPQSWSGTVLDVEKCRTGWTADGLYALWGNGTEIRRTELAVQDNQSFYTDGGTESLFAPTCFIPPGGGPERVVFTVGNFNPYLAQITLAGPHVENKVDLAGPGSNSGSGTFNDGLPSVSSDGSQLIIPREELSSPDTRSALIAVWDNGIGDFVSNPATPIIIQQNIRSAVWLP